MSWTTFKEWFLPSYRANQLRYLNGTLLPGPDWPVDWFADMTVDGQPVSATEANLTWDTQESAVCEVRWLEEQEEYAYSFDDLVWCIDQFVTPPVAVQKLLQPASSQSYRVQGLKPDTTYYVRVRCSPSATSGEFDPGASQVYGGFTSFRTPAD